MAIATCENRLANDAYAQDFGLQFDLVRSDVANGAVLGWAALMSDVTEHRASDVALLEAEQRFRLMVESVRRRLRAVTDAIGEALCTLDDAGHVSYVNPACERLLGWSPADLQRRSLHDVVHRGRHDGSGHTIDDCPMHAGHRARVAVRVADDTFVTRGGLEVPVSWVLTPVPTPEGDSSVIMITDNTNAKLARRQSRREVEQLEQIRVVREALAERRFELFAQPIVDLRTGAHISYDLLPRMRERGGTIRVARSSLPTAGPGDALQALDRWVIGEAARLAGDGHNVKLSLSAQSVREASLADDLIAALSGDAADPTRIVVELTETPLQCDDMTARTFIERIRALGCKVALGGLGAGFGTFSSLKRLPIDYQKIDVEFVRDVSSSAASRHVVEAMVSLARSFGHRTIAEGVDDDEACQTLRGLGVDYAQGDLIGPPAPLDVTLQKAVLHTQAGVAEAARSAENAIERPDAMPAEAVPVNRRRRGDAVTDRAARAYMVALRVGNPHAASAVVDGALQDGLSGRVRQKLPQHPDAG